MKNIVRSNEKHFIEMIPQDHEIIIKNLKDAADSTKENPQKIQKSRYSIDIRKNNLIGKKYVKRRSMNNEILRDKLEHLLNEQALKQNGGSTLFLTNYEKGRVIEKEFEFIIKNKKIKKKIRIGSCTKAGCSGPGIVKTNQDAYFIKEDFLNNNIFLGVCDGHGIKGEMISNYVTKKLPIYTTDINNESISNSFKKINSEIYSNKNIESDMAGTTVVSLIITADKIICPNLGDSRAVLYKFENNLYFCKNLSRDHKPSEPEENRRIIYNNGRIKKIYDEELKKYVGPDRVWLKNKEEPGLAMTRSIGDKIAHSIGVSDEPEIKIFEHDVSEKFAIIASDGIWEYMSGEDCLKVIKPFYEDNKDVEEASYSLVKEAFRKWKRKEAVIDDITVILIFFEE
jgi:serine/threonine protein phosphatase PrpC/stress-induced morphogen